VRTNLFLILLLSLFAFNFNAQTDLCNGAAPFCTGTTYNFAAPVSGTEAEVGPDYGCLSSQPNPVWYYLQIASNGTIVMDIAGADAFLDDIDFACWGPFTTPTGGCAGGLTADCGGFFGCESNTSPFASYPAGNLVDCSYDGQAAEVCTIPNAIAGQYYMVLITNYGGNVTNIIFDQTNTGQGGAGATNCNILCNITNMTATPGACIPGNTFNVTGTISTTAPPSSGTLTISSSCGVTPTVINPPFTTSTNYTLNGANATGAACSITAAYSADPTCTYTVNITAPAPCNTPTCSITQVTAVPGACAPATSTYQLTGSVTFTNPPASGTLSVTGSCGGTQTFNAPFVSPLTYTLTGLTANAAACNVNASFSAAATCTATASYTAPAACNPVLCSITQVTATPGACNATNNTHDVSGSITFVNPPASGTLSVTGSCGGTQTFNAPFTSPLSYTLTGLPADAASCGVTAVFSADVACTSNATYTAPASCSTCTVTAANDGPVCEGATINLSCLPAGATSYSWTGPNGYASSLQNPSISSTTPTISGTYSVSATFPDGSTCNATTLITINPLPVADAGADVSVCVGGSVQLNAQGGATYVWAPSASLDNAAIANPTATPSAATTYFVIVTSADGCVDTDDVTVSIITSVTAIVSSNTTICTGQSTNLTSSGGSSYSWNPSTGLSSSTISNPIASPTVTTTYSVTVSAGPGCPPDIEQVTITVNPLPNVTVSPNDTICPGQFGVVHAYNATSYVWQGVGITTDSIISNPTSTTNYTVIGTSGGCSNTAVGTIVVIPSPIVDFITTPQEEPGNYIVGVENYSSLLYNSYWTINSTDTLRLPQFEYDFKNPGTYTICLYGENLVGCSETECRQIVLKPDWAMYIPNTFTPNDDGINDVFYCYGTNLVKYELMIFDRWGEMIYVSTDEKEGWKGNTKMSSILVKEDTYIYKVKITDPENRRHTYSGHVNVVR
jgi:gliding motility-associated-like protein